jgi:hypothetical protein
MTYLFHVSIALDQLLNVVLGGYPDETLSARCWREKHWARYVIDVMFWWQYRYEKSIHDIEPVFWKAHCQQSYDYEKARMDLPVEYR